MPWHVDKRPPYTQGFPLHDRFYSFSDQILMQQLYAPQLQYTYQMIYLLSSVNVNQSSMHINIIWFRRTDDFCCSSKLDATQAKVFKKHPILLSRSLAQGLSRRTSQTPWSASPTCQVQKGGCYYTQRARLWYYGNPLLNASRARRNWRMSELDSWSPTRASDRP